MKIHSVRIVKTELAREDSLNFVKIKNPFGFLQTNPQADAWWAGLNLLLKKIVFWYTLVKGCFELFHKFINFGSRRHPFLLSKFNIILTLVP